MASGKPEFERRLDGIFRAEASEHLERMRASLARMAEGPDGDGHAGAVQALFRATHSLKGAARAVGRDAVEGLCHAMETSLSDFQRGRRPWGDDLLAALREGVGAIERSLASAQKPAEAPRVRARPEGAAAPALPPVPSALPETMRVGLDRLDGLLQEIEELVAAKLDSQQLLPQVQADLRSPALRNALMRQQRQLGATVDALLARIKGTLLLPVESLTPFLAAAVGELSASERKPAVLRLHADGVELDRRLLEQLRDPLVHLLRNAIFHGIEAPERRADAGKPAQAVIDAVVRPVPGGRVLITVSDDGAGIDTARLLEVARERGVPVPDGASDAELAALVFSPGVSTAPRLTRVAGRGMGLAIVREAIERMGGAIGVESTPGRGTRFTMTLPLSLATFRALEVSAAGRSFLVPSSQVERCAQFDASRLRRIGAQSAVDVDGQHVPLVSLAAALDLPLPERTARVNCLLLRAGDQRVAFAVDSVPSESEVLAKAVERGLTTSPIVTGAAALGPARTLPVLNAAELLRIAARPAGLRAALDAPAKAAARARILVAEDSITSRTLLKNLLGLAGYEVDTAADGQEALRMLRERPFDLLVSDVEMPQMDGIALTSAVRADPAMGALPVVLVTSLGSPLDRERGAEAGADAYIVKSSFDQGDLLRAVEELL